MGQKMVKFVGGPQWLCWLLVSSGAKSVVFACSTSHCELQLFPLCELHWWPLLLFLFPSHLYVSQLCWSGWGEIEVGPSCSAQRLGKLVAHPALPFLVRKLFLAGKFPLDAEQYWLGKWDDTGKKRLFSLLVPYTQGFCSTVLLKFLKRTPELSQCLFTDNCLIVDLCGGMEVGISYSALLVTSWINYCLHVFYYSSYHVCFRNFRKYW